MNLYHREAAYMVRFCALTGALILVSVLLMHITMRNTGDTDRQASETICPMIDTIILDPGHGGEDGGAVSDDGLIEKEINLDIAKTLCDMLRLSDYRVMMTRTDDRLLYSEGQENRKKFYDIENRIRYAESQNNALVLSIHQNKFPIRKYSGFQVYASPNHPQSMVLAECLRDSVITYLQPDNKREVKTADRSIKLLHRLTMPSVLAECGFLSNPDEAQKLGEQDYRNKMAFSLSCGTLDYMTKQEGDRASEK